MKNIIFLTALAALAAGCSKSGVEDTQNAKARIDFAAALDIMPVRATSDVPLNTHASMWVYAKDGVPGTATAEVAGKEYNVATSAGVFDAVGGAAIYLNYGAYDFYSVGVVNYDAVNYPLPVFTGTPNAAVSGATLKNGADYIFAKAADHSVAASAASKTVSFTYAHACSKVEISVVAGSGVTVNDVTAARITPADPAGSTMSLTDGTIGQAANVLAETSPGSKDNLKNMTAASSNVQDGSSWVFDYITLPLAASKTLTVELTVNYTLNGTPVTGKTFTGTFATPSDSGAKDGFKSGNNYKYTVKVNGNGIVFSSCTVGDWTEQNGFPDIPTTED